MADQQEMPAGVRSPRNVSSAHASKGVCRKKFSVNSVDFIRPADKNEEGALTSAPSNSLI